VKNNKKKLKLKTMAARRNSPSHVRDTALGERFFFFSFLNYIVFDFFYMLNVAFELGNKFQVYVPFSTLTNHS
jgi:hypothetical protein